MFKKDRILALLAKVDTLVHTALKAEEDNRALLKKIHPRNQPSAKNLLHYLAIRAQDITKLQLELSELAISSISHAEPNMLDTLQKIRHLLATLAQSPIVEKVAGFMDSVQSAETLKKNSSDLFGHALFEGETKLMVTLPTEAGTDAQLVLSLVLAGMDIARINTAHDNEETWAKMVRNVKNAASETGRKVKIYMDLEDPKIRTGDIQDRHTDGHKKGEKAHLTLCKGDKLILSNTLRAHHKHPVVTITAPEVLALVKEGESIWFDDGKLGGVIIKNGAESIEVEITEAPDLGFKLKPQKGINFPDSALNLPALTESDVANLQFIAKHAHMVGYSFVQKPEDIVGLQRHLKKLKREDMGIILKIETHLAFTNFASLLFAAMCSEHCGVMIARGDLAVEIGYLRIAEVQEEIMWLSEAAHLPVIWATQVLENLIKNGIATRAEISDVVKAVRAECVMLNKGEHIVPAIKMVKDIDKEMAAHENKKRRILRSLNVAKVFLG